MMWWIFGTSMAILIVLLDGVVVALVCRRRLVHRAQQRDNCCFFAEGACRSPFLWIRLAYRFKGVSLHNCSSCCTSADKYHVKIAHARALYVDAWKRASLHYGLPVLLSAAIAGILTIASLR